MGFLEQFVGAGGFAEREPSGDNRLNFAGCQEAEELREVVAEPGGIRIAQSFDVVPVGAFAARKELEQGQRSEADSGGQLPFGDSGACTIASQCAAGTQATVRSQPVFAADGVEDAVNPARSELVNAFDKIFGTIVDGCCTERVDEFVFGLRGGSEHFEAGDFPKLQRGGADSAGGAVDEEALALAEIAHAVEHLVGGDVVEDEADGFGGVELLGNGDEMRCGNESVLRIAADHGECGDALTESELRDSRTEGVDVADDVVARGEWKWRNFGIEAVAHEYVGVSDAGSEIFDADLAGARRG